MCPQPGFTLPRRQFVTLNRLRCGQARCAESLHWCGVIASPACPCGERPQGTLLKSAHSLHSLEACYVSTKRVPTQWNMVIEIVYETVRVFQTKNNNSKIILNLLLSAKTVANRFSQKVLVFVANGLPSTCNQYKDTVRNAQAEITSKDVVLLRDSRVVNPTALRAKAVNMAHSKDCIILKQAQINLHICLNHFLTPNGSALKVILISRFFPRWHVVIVMDANSKCKYPTSETNASGGWLVCHLGAAGDDNIWQWLAIRHKDVCWLVQSITHTPDCCAVSSTIESWLKSFFPGRPTQVVRDNFRSIFNYQF